MSKQSIVSEVALSGPTAIQLPCMQIKVTWTSSGGSSFQVNRQQDKLGSVVVKVASGTPVPTSIIDTVPDTQLYIYTVTVWGQPPSPASGQTLPIQGTQSCPTISSGFLIQSTIDTFESRKGSFELLFTQGGFIKHYTHKKGSFLTRRWEQVNTLSAPEGGSIQDNSVSLIQRTSRNSVHFEAVAVVTPLEGVGPNYLAYYKFRPKSGWQEPVILTADGQSITGATGTPALIQTRQGPLHLFVPKGNSIGHYTQEQDSIQDDWTPLAPFGTSDTLMYTAISLVQAASANLELVVGVAPLQTPPGGSMGSLVSFVARSIDPQAPIQQVGPLTADGQSINGVTGSPTFIQIDQDIFGLVVPRKASLDYYIMEADTIGKNSWKHVSTLEPFKNDPGIQFTATSMIESTSRKLRKLELVARVMPPQGEDYVAVSEFTGWQELRPIVVDDTTAH